MTLLNKRNGFSRVAKISRDAKVEPLEQRQLLSASVTGLTLINADTDKPVPGFVMGNSVVIDLAQVGQRLNIRADVSEAAGSVRFNYDGNPNYKVETGAPYAFAGNSGSDYLAWTPTLGTHTLVATPHASTNGSGALGGSRSITFQVIDSTVPPAPYRVNAGGSTFTSGDGRVFTSDTNFTGGTQYSSTFNVANTTDDGLYRTRREGSSFSFSKSVSNGTYLLTLHFAEPTKTAKGQRKFDVTAENKLVLNDFDVYAAAGARQTAVSRTLTVPVNDGRISVSFKGVTSSAIVSAIEVIAAAPAPLAVPAPAWINAGGGRYVDSVGRTFEPDSGFIGGTTGQANYDVQVLPAIGKAAAIGYSDDPLLLDYRSGASFTFSRPVANGNYAVWLEFAEPIAGTAAGQRVFDVSAEGSLVVDNYDIVADASAAQLATAKTFNVTVRDGKLDLAFKGEIGDALIGAIAIAPTDIPAAALPYAGVTRFSDPVKQSAAENAWLIRSASNLRQIGQAIYFHANENKGKFPADLAALMQSQNYLSHTIFTSPRAASALSLPRGEFSLLEQTAFVDAASDYVYVGSSLKYSNATSTAWMAYENPDRVPGSLLNVLFGDGHVEYVARAEVIARHSGSGATPIVARPLDVVGDSKIVVSQQNLRQMGMEMGYYANEHKGILPPDFGTLYATGQLPLQTFINPRGTTTPPPANATEEQKVAWINASTDYVFSAAKGRSSRYRADEVIAYENPAAMAGGINLLFGDGHVEFREMRWALETLSRPRP